jgi:PGF-pre-PGF domain-containing protein
MSVLLYMRRITVAAVLVALAVVAAQPAVGQSDESYSISVENAEMVETPERTIQGTTVSSIAAISEGESLEVSVSTGTSGSYRLTLYTSDREIAQSVELTGNDSASMDTTNLDPGTYALAVGGFETVQPVVIRAYETTLSVPSESPEGDTITAEISFSGTSPTPATVQAVIANDEMNETITAEQTGEGEYEATIETTYEPGDYRLYAVAQNDETVTDGFSEIIAISGQRELSITTAGSEDENNGGDSGSGDGGSGGDGNSGGDRGSGGDSGSGSSGEDTPADGSTDTTTGDSGDTSGQHSAVIEPRADTGESYVAFEAGSAVEAITFAQSNMEGNVTVTTDTAVPDDVEPPADDPLQISRIEVPASARNTTATLRIAVPADRVSQSGVSASGLRVTRFANTTWEPLTTTVINETADRVVLEATTPGFSYFAVTADDETENTATDDNDTDTSDTGNDDADTSDSGTDDQSTSDTETIQPNTNSTDESASEDTDASTPGFGPSVAIISLLMTIGSVVLYRGRD